MIKKIGLVFISLLLSGCMVFQNKGNARLDKALTYFYDEQRAINDKRISEAVYVFGKEANKVTYRENNLRAFTWSFSHQYEADVSVPDTTITTDVVEEHPYQSKKNKKRKHKEQNTYTTTSTTTETTYRTERHLITNSCSLSLLANAEDVVVGHEYNGNFCGKYAEEITDYLNRMPPEYINASVAERLMKPVIEYYPNGQKRSEYFIINGMKDGLVKTWYTNGQRQTELSFSLGKQEGLSRTWHRNGKLKSSGQFHNDQVVGKIEYWEEY